MHEFAEHVAAVKVPKAHELDPDTVYPELRDVGVRRRSSDPLGFVAAFAELVQRSSPRTAFVGAVDASHGFAEHVAAVSVPALQDDVPDTVYPELHVGWQVDPLAKELVQSPTPPFVGAADASHGFKEHVAAVSVPAVQELVPETTYPELHVGWHVDPLARTSVQSPTAPFVGVVDASQDKLNTRTWPASVNAPVPSFLGAPIATRVPSEDIDTDHPE